MTLLKNDKISLRPLEPEDLDLLYEWENDSSIWAAGSTVSPYSRYTLKEYIAQSHRCIYEMKQLRLMIDTCDGSVGLADFYDFDVHNRKVAAGVLIDPNHRGKGIATGTLTLMKGYAFSFLKLHQLYAYMLVANEASRRLLDRCGFTLSGVLTDWTSAGGGFSDVLLFQCINQNQDSGRVSEPVE
ncbi:MAG: GNAT family N-acetyltransferase [Tannerellaceae bacterium]|jgi:diamine N-acetyltransferase|nr:GNAT family N-acetyltransferase [Tannerellaceae bacterium]